MSELPSVDSSGARPRVTVIIIFLDEERFLAQAVRSVLTQTCTEWELLLVDDGSKDGSSALAKSFAAEHPAAIRYLEHPGHANRGMSASRNLGLSHARGEYVGFLDADDDWVPAKLQEQLAVFDAHPQAAMVYGRTLIWHSWDPDARTADFFYELGVKPDAVVMPPVLLALLLQNRYQTPTTCNALVRRRAIDEVHGFEDSFRGMFEDQVFFMKIAARYPVYVASRCWARYRQRADSRSSLEAGREARAAHGRLLDWLEGYLARVNLSSQSVERQLRRQRWALRWPRLHKIQRLLGGSVRTAKAKS